MRAPAGIGTESRCTSALSKSGHIFYIDMALDIYVYVAIYDNMLSMKHHITTYCGRILLPLLPGWAHATDASLYPVADINSASGQGKLGLLTAGTVSRELHQIAN